MEVSTFELIFKPQSPAAPAGVPAVDRVIQGYFLAIANLEAREYRYRVEFVVPPVPPGTPNAAFRTPAGNTLVFVDSGGGDNAQGVLSGAATQERFVPSTGLVRVPALGTALVAVLPSAFGPLPGEPTPLALPTFETRGFVRLTLPAVRKFPESPFIPVPQSDAPVRVLLTPQHRATFLRADDTIASQVQATLPLAGGRALVEVPPEPGGLIVSAADLGAPRPGALAALDAAPAERGAMLAALLADLDGGGGHAENLDVLNEALAGARIPLSVVRANGGG
jgi:hypothetical protein